MTRTELAGLYLVLLVLGVLPVLLWRLFRPHRGTHVYDLAPVPIPRLEYGSMILEEETRIRVHERETAPLRSTGGYLGELAPETLDEEATSYAGDTAGSGVGGLDRQDLPLLPASEPESRRNADLFGVPEPSRNKLPDLRVRADELPLDQPPDLISMMSDEDFFHMARFEFRRLEWMASEPLTLPAWTGRAA